MIKRHAFSFSGWIVTLLFALAWRHNIKQRNDTENAEIDTEDILSGE